MKMIQLDGAEGGGQMLRTALSLAMITGQPFRMTQIRGRRPKPGLMRQHLTCVKAACEISGGVADGAEMGSTELVFRAGKVKGGTYRFTIGTAGSTLLLFQTLLPALLHADAPATLTLEGGTHNPMATPFEFVDRVFLPILRRMGGQASAVLEQTGFCPAGGGSVLCHTEPSPKLLPLVLHERGEVTALRIMVPIRNIRESIAERIINSALPHLPGAETQIDLREPGPGQGVCCFCEATFQETSELVTIYGHSGITAEKVGKRAARTLQTFLDADVPVGPHLADQLLLPMALAGDGSFFTTEPDDHVGSNISVIEKFLPVKFRVEEAGHGKTRISVS